MMRKQKQLTLPIKFDDDDQTGDRGNQLKTLNWIASLLPYKRMADALRAIDDTAREFKSCELAYYEIAQYMSGSESTARRACRELKKSGLLEVEQWGSRFIGDVDRRRQEGRDREPFYRFTIYWKDLQKFEEKIDHDDGQPDHDGGQSDHDGGHPDHDDGQSEHDTSLCAISAIPPPPNPPQKREQRAAEKAWPHPADEWGVVVEELIEYGVGDPQPAVEMAQQSGCSAPLVRLVIDYARSETAKDGTQAWGGGALRKRIQNLRPGQSIDNEMLWLPVNPAYEQARRREAEEQQEAERRRREAKREASIQDDLQKQDTLESEFGPALDSLSVSERNELITQVFDSFNQKLIRRALRRDGQIPKHDRQQLLKHLAESALSETTKGTHRES